MMRALSVLVLATLVAAPAFAEPTKDEKTNNDPNKVICRMTDEIGTRLAHKKVCMTKSEWEQQRRELQQTVQKVQDAKSHQG